MKRIVSFLVSLALVLSICGCAQETKDDETVDNAVSTSEDNGDKKVISLLYSYSDSFNPYTARTTANREIASLLYDSLCKTDNNFNSVNVLAESVEFVDKTYTVKLKNATFTDGSPVGASDVAYSYNVAKESARYTHNFYEVVSVSAVDSKTVVFNLTQNDPYFANLLTFPIVKTDTAKLTDADGKEIPPIGCGRYVLDESGTVLKLNQKYYGKKGKIEAIKLINSPDEASTSHYVEVGATAVYYTEGDKIVRMSGKKTEVSLNRLIYIGVNNNYGSLKTKELRYAISSAIDREAICRTAYYDNAECATGFFNPNFEPTKSLQTIESVANPKITVENLSKIGYNNMNSNGYYGNASGNNPVFTLLVNSESSSRVTAAKLIAEQCKTAGIQINVIECSYEQYLERLKSGNFHLYLGEIQVRENMDFSPLVTTGGSASYGLVVSSDKETDEEQSDSKQDALESDEVLEGINYCDAIFKSYHDGDCSISDVASTLLTEMPQIPICYLNGVLFYDSAIKGGVSASSSDIYLSIENYEF